MGDMIPRGHDEGNGSDHAEPCCGACSGSWRVGNLDYVSWKNDYCVGAALAPVANTKTYDDILPTRSSRTHHYLRRLRYQVVVFAVLFAVRVQADGSTRSAARSRIGGAWPRPCHGRVPRSCPRSRARCLAAVTVLYGMRRMEVSKLSSFIT